jgi:flagellar basal body-associated protein FliL
MAEDEAKKAAAAAAATTPPKGGKGGIFALILPALLAGGAAFGGARISGGPPPAPHVVEAAASEPPGPTVALDPFLVSIPEGQRSHVLKLTLAVELKHLAKEEEFRAYVPRIRDATLTYLRSLTFEEASNSEHLEQLRADIRERLKTIGATAVENVLITDFVTQ